MRYPRRVKKIVLDLMQVLELYNRPMTTEEVGRRLGCSRSTVDRTLARVGALRTKKRVGALHPKWRGGRYVNGGGYVMVMIDQGEYEYEHRVVMAKHLGRRLLSREVVHHRNGNRADNRISNLELLQSNGEHHRVHHRQPQRFCRKTMVRMYRQGMSMAQVGKVVGCSTQTVQRALQSAGVKSRKRSERVSGT